MELREYIKQYREENGLSMQEFADRCGLSKGYISMLESGKHPQNKRAIVPSIETYGKLARGMNMSIDALLRAIDGDAEIQVGSFIAAQNGASVFDVAHEEDDDFPEVRLIARAGKKMTPERKADMMRMLKMMFPEEFGEDE